MVASRARALGWSWYGGWPSTAAYRVAPRAQTSAAAVGFSPRASSGEKYVGVPMTMPLRVSWPWSCARAIPKSLIFATWSAVTRMLPGFTSRWMVPAAWVAASASAICAPIPTAASGDSGPSWAIICASVRDATYSMTSQMWSSSSTTS